MELSLWQNFYVLIGSSAGALIGLQFVVIALIASTGNRTSAESIGAFGTPTVVHFSASLTIAAIMCAPWDSLLAALIALIGCGLFGLGYSVIVFRRARRQTVYKPVAEDWLWYVILPFAGYILLTLSALFLRLATHRALFFVGGATLCLLLIGIHNAWDTVAHVVGSRSATDLSKPA